MRARVYLLLQNRRMVLDGHASRRRLGRRVHTDTLHTCPALLTDVEVCPDGLAIPGPVTPANSLAQLSILFWLFYGVSIGADLFMEAIETITSQEVQTQVAMPGGGKRRPLTVRVWNATIANLTLMALGSSAPEILLSVIEIVGNSFYSESSARLAIVGSAAFNLRSSPPSA